MIEVIVDGLGDVRDILERMKIQESTIYGGSTIDDELVGLWRKMLVEWMYYVIDHCHLQRHAVAVAAFFFDVAVRTHAVTTAEEHQLAAATALQLALKTHDSSIIRFEKLVKLGRGQFTEADVVKMEQHILKSLNWHLHPPTIYCFLRQYESLLPRSVSGTTRSMIRKVIDLACELTVADHQYLSYKPSEIAYASILLALEMIPNEDLSIAQRQVFILKMSSVAGMKSKCPVVLEASDRLQTSMNDCPKVEKLIASLEKRHNKQSHVTEKSHLNSKAGLAATHSPRHVMLRLLSG